MNKLTRRVSTDVAKSRATSLLSAALKSLRGESDIAKVLARLLASVEAYHAGIRKPLTSVLFVGSGPRDRDEYVDFLDSIKEDLHLLANEFQVSTKALTDAFNFIDAVHQKSLIKAQRLSSKVEDLAIISSVPQPNVFVAGDNFADGSNINFEHQSVTTQADIFPGGGGLTLKRVGIVNLVDPKITKVQVRTNTPYDASKPEIKPDLKGTFTYEGRYYAPAGQMEPAGGTLGWEQRVSSGGRELPPGEYQVQDPKDLETNQTLVPKLPTEQDLQAVRSRMFDNNPATYWQIEYNIKPFNYLQAAADTSAGDPDIVYNSTVYNNSPAERAAAIEQQIATADQTTGFDFDVELTIDLGATHLINSINLLPENFGDESWLELLDLSTSPSDSEPFVTIEGLNEQQYENVITAEANAELTDSEVKSTLAQSRYQYLGQGLWTFAPRNARFVYVKLRQKQPNLNPYQVVQIQLARHVTTTTTNTRKKGIFG